MKETASSVERNSEHKPVTQSSMSGGPNSCIEYSTKIRAEVGFHSNLWTGVISVAENDGTLSHILNELCLTSKANIYLQGRQ